MRILAIETSCDETAIAIAEIFGSKSKPQIRVLSNIVSSQVKLHAKYGGVVPNLAKREHQRNLVHTLLVALKEARLRNTNFEIRISKLIQNSKFKILNSTLEREPELLHQFKKKIVPLAPPPIDVIAVTYGPGLAPALWVGVNFARALAYLWGKPLIPVDHMAGHLYSAFLEKSGVDSKFQVPSSKFPMLALLVSGGHTELVLMRGHGKFKILGETLDDAAGEAFDKVARILGLGYPGGPAISHIAERGDPAKYPLSSPMINSKNYNFSFSGLKTAVLYLVRDVIAPNSVWGRRSKIMLPQTRFGAERANIAVSFEKALVDVLVKKTIRAAKEYKVKTVLLGGGVAANKLLRQELIQTLTKEVPEADCWMPEAALAGDNALMIATAAYFTGKKKAPSEVGADANARIGS